MGCTDTQPVHPGAFIKNVVLPSVGVSEYALAKRIRITQTHLKGIIDGKTSISPKLSLRLSRALGFPPGYFLSLQSEYDLYRAKQEISPEIERIEPFTQIKEK